MVHAVSASNCLNCNRFSCNATFSRSCSMFMIFASAPQLAPLGYAILQDKGSVRGLARQDEKRRKKITRRRRVRGGSQRQEEPQAEPPFAKGANGGPLEVVSTR